MAKQLTVGELAKVLESLPQDAVVGLLYDCQCAWATIAGFTEITTIDGQLIAMFCDKRESIGDVAQR